MKKIHIFLAALMLGSFTLASCGDGNDFTEPVNSLQVEQSETAFEAAGGTRTIVMRSGNVVQATVAAPWATATVSGNTVTVTAEMNSSRESRYTNVTLTAANGDQTVVTISQEGMIFVVKSGDIVVDDAAQRKTIEVRNTLPVSIVGKPDWLTVTVGDGTMDLDFQANNTGYIRSAYIKYQSGLAVDSFQVRQGELRDILGFYYMYFKSSPNQTGVHWTPTEITANEILVEEGVQRIRYTFDQSTLSLNIPSGQLIEQVDFEDGFTAYFYLSFLGTSGSTWSAYRDDIVATLSFDYRPDWGNFANIGGKFGTNDISGFTFRMCGDADFTDDSDTGQGIEHYAVTFLKWRKGTASSDHPEIFNWPDFMEEWGME